MKVMLNAQQYKLLERHSLCANCMMSADGKIYLDGDKKHMRYLLEKLTGILINEGLYENSEPNSEGLLVESTIDILNRAFY